MMKIHTLLPGMLALLTSAAVCANEAYSWVDEQGTTHFSEVPPDNQSRTAEQIELLPPPETGSTEEDDYYSVINQANRMEARRLENEKLEAERRKAEAEARRAAAEAYAARNTPPQDYSREEPRYYPSYPLYGYRPPYGRHPGFRPGHRPGRPHYPGRPGHLPVYPGGGYHPAPRRNASF